MLATFEETRLKKRLLSILRQKADNRPLYFDAYGFTPVKPLIDYLRTLKDFPAVNREDLLQVVRNDTAGQFEWDGGSLLRATYGFSPNRSHRGEEQAPPDLLYYGTHRKLLPQIAVAGLIPIASDLVQLAVLPGAIGQMEDTLFLLTVQARRAYETGIPFYRSSQLYYYSEAIPARFLQI